MANTTNFGWETPDDTDLVKDGAAAMRTLGNSIDASFVDLKGGTTGQVLAKASNTDLDFTWTTSTADITEVNAGIGISGGGTSGAVTITNSMATAIDAKGDLVAGTGADAFARLAVGSNNTVLTADSTTATGLKWAPADPLTTKGDLFTYSTTEDRLAVGSNGQVLTADSATSTGLKWATPSAADNFVLLNSGGTTLTGSITTISGISNVNRLFVRFVNASTSASGQIIGFRLNTDSNNNYIRTSPYGWHSNYITSNTETTSYVKVGTVGGSSADTVNGMFNVEGCNSTGKKWGQISGDSSGNASAAFYFGQYFYDGSSAITSISIFTPGTFDNGTVFVYGA